MSGASAGFYLNGQIGDAAVEARGTDMVVEQGSAVRGAVFGQGWAENPTSRFARRVGADYESRQQLGAMEDGTVGLLPRTPDMSAEEANARYGIAGRLTFDEPVPEARARDLNEHHRASIVREDIIARRQSGIGTGGVARFAVGLGAAVLDPLNVAAAFIPFLGEARVAAMVGSAAASGVGGRALVRGAVGAGQGFLGTLALEPANYWLSRQDQDDYDMGDVLTHLAFGTIIGGVAHSGFGALRDARRGAPAWSIDPALHEAALRQGMSAFAEGRPVLAADAMEYTAARRVRQELADWYEAQQRVDAEATTALQRAEGASGRHAVAAERLGGLQREAAALRNEIDAAAGRLDGVIDDSTRTRLAEIDKELAGTVPRARRVALEQERTMLSDGIDWRADALGVARTESEIAGLSAAEGRANSAAGLAAATERRAAAAVAKAEQAVGIASERLAAREAMTQALAERSLRRTAAAFGVSLAPDELTDMASRILRSKPEQARSAIDAVLGEIARKPRGTVADLAFQGSADRADARFVQAVRRTAQAEETAGNNLRNSLRSTPSESEIASDRATAAQAADAPKVEASTLTDELAEITESTRSMRQAIEQEEALQAKMAGREPAANRTLDGIDEITKTADTEARVYEAAAACMLRRV